MDTEQLLLSSAIVSSTTAGLDSFVQDPSSYAGWDLVTDHASIDFRDARPKLMPTAMVLATLRRANIPHKLPPTQRERAEELFAHAVAWLVREFDSDLARSPVESALVLFALHEFSGADASYLGQDPSDSIRTVRERIDQELRGGSIGSLPDSEPCFYTIARRPEVYENHYVTFPVRPILSSALVATGNRRRIDRWREILDVCDEVCEVVDREGAVVSAATGAKSITDSMYALEFLTEVLPLIRVREARWWTRRGQALSKVIAASAASAAVFVSAVLLGTFSLGTDDQMQRGAALVGASTLPLLGVWLGRLALRIWRRGS
ncbi:hypothetical protein [Agromyces binzhouensis]|uniref:hypothetical protein n=1 Tax=Agromyces binzhouensis TaxID=1817495 RepID=UPI00363201E1